MKNVLMQLREGPWRGVVQSIAVLLIGVLLEPAFGAIAPRLFQPENLPAVLFIMTSALFLISAVYAISFSNIAYARVTDTFERIDDLARSVGVRVNIVLDGSDAVKRAYPLLTQLMRDARREILVLDYLPVTEAGDIMGHGPKISSAERLNYYHEIHQRLAEAEKSEPESQQAGFQYHRLIQMSQPDRLATLVSKDEALLEHCKMLVEMSKRKPEFVTLKVCETFYEGTIIIVDQRYVVWEIDALDPRSGQFYAQCVLLFDDPLGQLVNEVLRLYYRIDPNATLVRERDLELTPE